MSVNGTRSDRLTRRVIRIRNGCLVRLAAHRTLPLPTEQEIASFDDSLGLGAAWQRWNSVHAGLGEQPAAVQTPTTTRRPRVRRSFVSALMLAIGLLGIDVFHGWPNQALASSNEHSRRAEWAQVNDSVSARVRGKLLGLSRAEVELLFHFSAAEAGALILGTLEPRPRLPLDSVEARIDSVLWLRGRVRDGPRVELGGRIIEVRPGRAELLVTRLEVDGVAAPPSTASRVLLGRRGRPTDRLQLFVPTFIGDLHVANGAVQLVTRGRRGD